MAKKGLKRLCGVLAVIAVIAVCGLLRGNVITASAKETYMIKAGTYRFNEWLSPPTSDIEQSVEFVCKADVVGFGELDCSCTGVFVEYGEGNVYGTPTLAFIMKSTMPNVGMPVGLSAKVYWAEEGLWNVDYGGEVVRTITISEEQEVSEEFYTWFTANAVELETITENIELPKDSVEYIWLYENHVEKNQFGDIQGPFTTDILDGLNIKGVYQIDLSKGLTSEQLAFIGNADKVMFEIDFVGKYGSGLTWSNTITKDQLIYLSFIGDEFSYQKEYMDNVSEVSSITYEADEIKGKHITDMYLTFSSKYISNKNVDVGLKEFECKITATTSEEIREYVLYDKYTEEDVNISILDKITNGFANIGNQVKKAVTDAVTDLFVPLEEDMVAQYDKWDTLMADRFGAVYESSQIIDSFVDAIQVSDTQETIVFPVVSLDIVGTTFEFGGWEVDIIPDGFQWLVDILKLITNIGCTVLFVNGMRTRYESVVK